MVAPLYYCVCTHPQDEPVHFQEKNRSCSDVFVAGLGGHILLRACASYWRHVLRMWLYWAVLSLSHLAVLMYSPFSNARAGQLTHTSLNRPKKSGYSVHMDEDEAAGASVTTIGGSGLEVAASASHQPAGNKAKQAV